MNQQRSDAARALGYVQMAMALLEGSQETPEDATLQARARMPLKQATEWLAALALEPEGSDERLRAQVRMGNHWTEAHVLDRRGDAVYVRVELLSRPTRARAGHSAGSVFEWFDVRSGRVLGLHGHAQSEALRGSREGWRFELAEPERKAGAL